MNEILLELCTFAVIAAVVGCFVFGLMTGVATIIKLV